MGDADYNCFMENELTPKHILPYPGRSTMDDDIESKEPALDETVGSAPDPEKKGDAPDSKKDDEKKAKFIKASREQQEKAKKAWEEENKKIEARGQKIPENVRRMQADFIEKGIEPRHVVSGASDGGPFAEFDAGKYKDTGLKDVAIRLKQAGQREEITEERLKEINEEVNVLTRMGTISEDENRRFKSDVNELIVKAREKNSTPKNGEKADGSQQNVNVSPEGGPTEDQINKVGLGKELQLINDLTDPSRDINATMNEISNSWRNLATVFDQKERQAKQKEFQAALTTQDVGERQQKLKEFLNGVVAQRKKNIEEGKVEVPQEITSIQGLAKFIMARQESELYGLGKKYALIKREENPETGLIKEVFKPENFLIWVRDQIIQLHDDNRTGEMAPLSAVAIETQLRTVTIYMMNRFRGQYFKDEETGQIMNDLAESATNMCYLFGFFRNMDLAYRQAMNSDEELPKIISGIHAKNDVTHGENWATFLSMPDKFGQVVEVEDEHGNKKKGRKHDTKVGDAELVANDLYYNLSDVDEIRDIVGDKSPFMTKEGFKRNLLMQQILSDKNKHEWEDPDDVAGLYDKEKDNFYVIDEAGQRAYVFNKDGTINRKNYFTFINFYNKPTPDKTNVDFVRDLIRLTIAEKVGIESGFAEGKELKERKEQYEKTKEESPEDAEKEYQRAVKAARINAKFAEYAAFAQQRPLMIAARNDVNRRGYDASTKLDLNYIVRQSGTKTAGPIGNTEFLKHQIIKNFSVDFVAGLKTENKKSPYELFHEIRNVMNGKKLNPDGSKMGEEQKEKAKAGLLAQLRFQDSAALDYSSNQVSRAFQIFHSVVDSQSLDLDKIVTRSFLEGIKYNSAEFEKQIKDEFLKPLRYGFASNAALKYGQMYNGFDHMKDGMPVYSKKTLAEHMFGDEVLDDIRDDAIKNKLDLRKVDPLTNKEIKPKEMTPMQRFQEYLNSDEARGRLVKNMAKARLAAELRKHRDRRNPAARWNSDMINKFLLSLETIREFKKDENGNIVESGGRFFEDKDISWIRKNSGTGYKAMFTKEAAGSISKGIAEGLFEGMKGFITDIFK